VSKPTKAELREQARRVKAAELEAAGELAEARAVLQGRCACLCGDAIAGGNVRTFYVDERHRKRHHRKRLERLADAAGVPARLSIETLRSANGTGGRPADAPTRPRRRQARPRPGVSVYFPTVDLLQAVERELAGDRQGSPSSRDEALDAVRKALERCRTRPPQPAR